MDRFQALFPDLTLLSRNRVLQPARTDVVLGHRLDRARYVVLYPATGPNLASATGTQSGDTVDRALVIAHVNVEAEQVDGALGF